MRILGKEQGSATSLNKSGNALSSTGKTAGKSNGSIKQDSLSRKGTAVTELPQLVDKVNEPTTQNSKSPFSLFAKSTSSPHGSGNNSANTSKKDVLEVKPIEKEEKKTIRARAYSDNSANIINGLPPPLPNDMNDKITTFKHTSVTQAKADGKLETVQGSPNVEDGAASERRTSIDNGRKRSSTLPSKDINQKPKSPAKEKRRNSLTAAIYHAVAKHTISRNAQSNAGSTQASTHHLEEEDSGSLEQANPSHDSSKNVYGLTGTQLESIVKSHNTVINTTGKHEGEKERSLKLYTSSTNVKTKHVSAAIPINKSKKTGSSVVAISETPQMTQDELNPLDVLEKIESTKHYIWNSPIIKSEIYITDVFFDGDESKMKGLINKAILESSMDQVNQSVAASQDIFATDRLGNLVKSTQKLNLNASSANLKPENDGKELFASSNNLKAGNAKSTSLLNNPNSHSASGIPMRAPKLPKRAAPANHNVELISDGNRQLTKFNSCSTLFTIDSTLFQPLTTPHNLELTLKAVAHAIMSHLDRTYSLFNELLTHETNVAKANGTKRPSRSKSLAAKVIRTSDMLSEKMHPIWKARIIPDEVISHPEIMQAPTFDEVYLFLKQIFVAADLSAELGIITLIYLERLLYRTHITLHGINVFRAILSALMLASKVWDDQAVWNVDFHTIFSDLKLNDLNQLERWLLGKINFDVSVKRNVFARYWFEVREVAEKLWGVRMSAMASNMRLNASTANMLKSNSNVHKKEGKSITQLNKSQHDFSDSNNHPVPVLPKPLTEATLKNVIHVSTTFSQTKLRENFKDQLGVGSDKDSNGSKSANKLNISKAATKSGNSISEGKSSKQISEGTQVKNIPSTSGDFGWGGSNLRKTKSTDFYKPTVPNASVL